jgi:hypothetical protein
LAEAERHRRQHPGAASAGTAATPAAALGMLANTLAGRGAITLNERIWAHFFSAVENERAQNGQ